MSIAHLISLEVRSINSLGGFGTLATFRQLALVTVIGMEMSIYMTSEVISAVKPRADANKYAIRKPFRTIVTGRSAVIGRNIIVSIRTIGRRSHFDRNLSLRHGSGCQKTERCDSR